MSKVLLVDDEPHILGVLEKLLNKFGYETATAKGGGEALEILRGSDALDLMIIDLKMPRIGGIAVLKELKSMDRKLPVIILSGAVEIEQSYEMAVLGIPERDILHKPTDLHKLLAVVREKVAVPPLG